MNFNRLQILVGMHYLIKNKTMNKILRISNFIIVFSLISLYTYILAFYLKFDKIETLDPKNLNIAFIYESIKFFYLIAFLFAFLTPILIIAKLIRRDKENIKLIVLSLILSVIFLLIDYIDYNHYLFWFFD